MPEVERQMQKSSVRREGPVRHKAVDVRVEMKQLPEGLYGQNSAGCGFVAQQGVVDGLNALPGEPGQLAEQVAVVSKEYAEAFGDGPDELPVRHGEADIVGDVHAEQESTFL